jgi:hypothetical protein
MRKVIIGRAIVQAISRRLLIAAARVRAQVRLRGICSGQSGTPSTSVSPVSVDCSTLIIYRPGLVQKISEWPTCKLDSVSPHPKKLKINVVRVRCL